MELNYLLVTGALSGLVSALGHSVLWSGIAMLRSQPQRPPFAATVQVELIELLLHLLAGVTLGFLFWLSWGLTALVGIPWWMRGLAFGGLCWLALVLPTLLSISIINALPWRAALATAIRWATTCVIAGLSCAWSWDGG